jgi:hypothetical protein
VYDKVFELTECYFTIYWLLPDVQLDDTSDEPKDFKFVKWLIKEKVEIHFYLFYCIACYVGRSNFFACL